MLTQNKPSAGIFGWLQKGQKYELEGRGRGIEWSGHPAPALADAVALALVLVCPSALI